MISKRETQRFEMRRVGFTVDDANRYLGSDITVVSDSICRAFLFHLVKREIVLAFDFDSESTKTPGTPARKPLNGVKKKTPHFKMKKKKTKRNRSLIES